MSAPFSLVVRTRLRSEDIEALVRSIESQSRRPAEVVWVDSGSDPGRRRDLGAQAAHGGAVEHRIVDLPPGSYTSAGALNAGIDATRQRFVAILSQDALPAAPTYFENLFGGFHSADIAGVYGRQVPRGAIHPLTRKDLEHTYPASSRDQAAPDCWFVNTCSAIRRELWREFPFDERAGIVEDHAWARALQQRGFRVRYEASAVVRHHHDLRAMREVWRRFFLEGRGLAALHGERPGIARCLGRLFREIGSDAVWLARRRRPHLLPGGAVRRIAKHAALYLGANSVAERCGDPR